MQVILKEDVTNLGKVGDVVTVKPGYARNKLLPSKQAVPVNEENLAILAKRREALEQEAEALRGVAQQQADAMKGVELKLVVQAHEDGQLFGSVSVSEIQKGLNELGYDLEKRVIHIDQGSIKTVGVHEVTIQLHQAVKFKLPVHVSASDTVAMDLTQLDEIEADAVDSSDQ
ncbi:MAG: 50S ribosomal protein L9 [Legionellales bacterium]|nr:50S ribosomal protein L9 [Legionellales bacterium]|tara:strand:- start:343 stop:858 length:516 start_codon:yes stop_codon:yes gene_type:complete